MAAKVVGELPRSFDPAVSEWGNPSIISGDPDVMSGGVPPELKHLSKGRKRNQRDSVSSGERKRNSLNPERNRRGLQGPAYGIYRG